MLLNALASLRLLSKQDGIFTNSPATARYLMPPASRDNARPALLHTAHLWHRWSTLTDCVRAGTAVAQEEIAARGQDWTEAFIAAMHRNASERAPLVVRAVGAENVRPHAGRGRRIGRLLDRIRPGEPRLAGRHPGPGHGRTDRAAAHRGGRSGGPRRIRAGDLRSDQLGEGYDLVFVSAICHMLSPAENLDLLRRCREALAPGGRVVIQDFILEADKTAPRFAALFALEHAGGHARRQQLQRTGVCRLAAGRGFPAACECVRCRGPPRS